MGSFFSYPVIIVLFIMLVWYGLPAAYGWNSKTTRIFQNVCNMTGMPETIMEGGSIWGPTTLDPYIHKLCLTDDSILLLQMRIMLFAGHGRININERAYNMRLCKLLTSSETGLCSYDPLSCMLSVKNTKGSIYELFNLARTCTQITEAFPKPANANPCVDLREYHKKYVLR